MRSTLLRSAASLLLLCRVSCLCLGLSSHLHHASARFRLASPWMVKDRCKHTFFDLFLRSLRSFLEAFTTFAARPDYITIFSTEPNHAITPMIVCHNDR